MVNEGTPPCDCCYVTLRFDCPICKKEIMVYEQKHNMIGLSADRDDHIKECMQRKQNENNPS